MEFYMIGPKQRRGVVSSLRGIIGGYVARELIIAKPNFTSKPLKHITVLIEAILGQHGGQAPQSSGIGGRARITPERSDSREAVGEPLHTILLVWYRKAINASIMGTKACSLKANHDVEKAHTKSICFELNLKSVEISGAARRLMSDQTVEMTLFMQASVHHWVLGIL
ncbi:hypothetical protein LA080_008599 [Diaporthe eres]|nr:hypothetical protein LA080_008599 [Diaporthe eres]